MAAETDTAGTITENLNLHDAGNVSVPVLQLFIGSSFILDNHECGRAGGTVFHTQEIITCAYLPDSLASSTMAEAG